MVRMGLSRREGHTVERAGIGRGAGWQAEVKGMLKAEMKRRNVTYDHLAGKLVQIGVKFNAVELHGGKTDWIGAER